MKRGNWRHRKEATLMDQIKARCYIAANGCWLWMLFTDKDGYGVIQIDKKPRRAHKVAYEEVNGPVPDGLVLDHKCNTRRCANPSHVEPTTHRENVLRAPTSLAALNLLKTHCPKGHEYNEANTYHKGRERVCRECQRIRQWNRRHADV